MNTFVAYITPNDGIPRRFALISFDVEDAQREAQLLGKSMFQSFTFSVFRTIK